MKYSEEVVKETETVKEVVVDPETGLEREIEVPVIDPETGEAKETERVVQR